jgi:uncharacterized membrane protein YkoI
MGKISKLFVMLAMALVVGVTVPHVFAQDECGVEPCERGQPPDWAGQGGQQRKEQDVLPGPNGRDSFENQGDLLRSLKQQRRAERIRQRQRQETDSFSQPGYDDSDDGGRYVQFNEQEQGLIGETEALTQALAAVPGSRALGVRLLKGQPPMYAVKLRVRGKVRRILVDARTAQILGE